MKVVQINATCGVGSTGRICVGISEQLNAQQIENYILYSSKTSGYPGGLQCSTDADIKLQSLKSHVFGNYGFNSQKATKKMIQYLEEIKPDIVHLHNIHGHDCDLGLLFSYFKEKKQKLVWTFHDCWTFTAYCAYFSMCNCEKWKSGCFNCSQKNQFSFLFDKSRELFDKKKKLFTGLDLTIVTPSKWLCDVVKESFFKDYPVRVIYNGIDLDIFKPTESDFKKRYNVPMDKKIVLGVSLEWGQRKGLDVFLELSKRLDDKKYQIVLVGTNPETDKLLPDNVISIHRTESQKELAEIYTAADVFVNPTRDEVLGLVNIEAIACGTPVITFNSGGSPECIDKTCGVVIDCDDVDAAVEQIGFICTQKPFDKESCIKYAENFDKQQNFRKYLDVYREICFD
ncbi:MAG: glycosyltransferase [Ruminococcus sp.]|nr:glycosyltransferase [Ruminococcus sp.]